MPLAANSTSLGEVLRFKDKRLYEALGSAAGDRRPVPDEYAAVYARRWGISVEEARKALER
jgi:hypothetical protein